MGIPREYLRQIFTRYAHAAVLHRQQSIFADRQYLTAHRAHLCGQNRARFDAQHTAPFARSLHGIAGVDAKVDDHLFKLTRVRTDRPNAPSVLDLQLDAFAQ